MANTLFNQLCSNLHRASDSHPSGDCVCLGFTNVDPKALKNPFVIFYDSKTDAFYLQGFSKNIPKSSYSRITSKNCKRSENITKTIKYYIPMTESIIDESDKPLD